MSGRSIEERLGLLEDMEAIKVVKWRYLRACDRKQPDAVAECLTPDAIVDYEGFPLFTDRDSFVSIYREFGCVPNIIDMHHGQNPIVEVDGDNARGWFDLYFYQIDTNTRRLTQLAVNYDDSFVRRDGRWLIARTVSRRMSMLVSEIGDDHIARIALAARSDVDGPMPPPR